MPTIEELAQAADEELNVSLSQAVKKSPDQSAKVYNLSRENHLPFEYVERNSDKVQAPDPKALTPNVAQFLRERRHAEIGYDDIENLSWWEKTGKELKNVGSLFPSAAKSVSSSGYAILGNVFDLLSEATLAPLRPFVDANTLEEQDIIGPIGDFFTGIARQERAGAEYYFPKDSVLPQSVLGGIKSAILNTPALAASALTRNPNLALGIMGGVTYGDSYLRAKDAGLSLPQAMMYATNDAIAEVVTEKIPVFNLLEDLGANKGFMKTLMTQLASEIPGEQVATLWQDLSEWASLNPDKPFSDYVKERPSAAVDTLISTIVATGLQTSAVSLADRMTREQEVIQDMSDKVRESKVNQRSPELFKQFLQDGVDGDIYLNAAEVQDLLLNEKLQDGPELGPIRDQLQEALSIEGGDIVIPISEASDLLNSGNFETLKPLMRLSPEQAADNVQQLIAEANQNIELKTRADEIYKEVEQQLIDTKRMDKRTAKFSAVIVPAFVTTLAARSGKTVDEIYAMMPLQIVGPNVETPQGQQILDQAKQEGYEGEAMGEALEWRRAYEKFGKEGMTTEARMARAKEMGFDTSNVYYHGTGYDIKSFRGNLRDTGELGGGTYLTENPKSASGYAEDGKNPNIIPVYIRVKKILDVTNKEDMPSTKQMIKQGYDAVVDRSLGRHQISVFNPKNIRSVNAAFDPDYADSPLLLAQSEDEASVGNKLDQSNLEETEAFKKWAGTDQVIEPDEINDTGFGGNDPYVLKAYHGTTHTFEEFNASIRGTKEGQFGAVNYFTSSEYDAGQNYTEGGPDLTNRIEFRSEQLEQKIEDMFEEKGRKETLDQLYNETGNLRFVSSKIADMDDSEAIVDAAKTLASMELKGDEGRVLEVYVKTEKPFIVGDDSPWLEFVDIDELESKAIAQVAENNDISEDDVIENRDDYEDQIDEARWEIEADTENELVSAIETVATKYGIDPSELMSELYEVSTEGTTHQNLEELFRNTEALAYAEDPETGELAGYHALGEIIQELGFDSIILKNANERFKNMNMNPGTAHIHVFDANNTNIKSVENQGTFDPNNPNIYQQKERGSITFLPNESIIQLTEASDLSTFLHEAGHLFLEMEKKLYADPNITPQMKADGDRILKWLGVESFDDIKVEHHEKFARGFEKYLAEGKAPSVELQSAFRRFAAWIKQVYRDLLRLKVTLDDDIRGVMDRMLATDEAIERAKGGFSPLFASAAEAGMTEKEYESYTRQSVPESAKEDLMAKMVKQLKRETTKWWRDESASLQGKIEKELLDNPLYSATETLKGNHQIKGLDSPKLSKAVVRATLGEVTPRFRGMTAETGMDADELAAIFGFASGNEMIHLVDESPTFAQAVKAATEAEMVRRHGDILNDGTIEEQAQQAIRSPEHARKLLAELNAISRKTKTPTVDRESLKEYAKSKIGAMAYTKIRPADYRAVELRAAKQAVEAKNKGDFSAAQRYKTQQLINFYLSREAQKARDKAESNRKYLKASGVREYKDINPNYATQIRTLANLYDFRKSRSQDQSRALGQLQSIAQWIVAQENNKEAHVSPVVLDPAMAQIIAQVENNDPVSVNIPSYKDMTVDQIQAVADQVKNLRYIGKQLSDEQKAAFKAKTDELAQSILDNAKGEVTVPQEPTQWDRRLSALREFGEDHVRLANQIAQMDGYKEFGPLFQDVYQKIVDASNVELKYKREALVKLKEAFAQHKHSDLKEGKGEITVETNDGTLTLSHRGRIMLGLYWGSPEGREAIRQGHNMTDAQVQKMLDTLEDKDVDLIEKIWKANETFWPEVSRIHQKLKGVTLPKVDHVPFRIGDREVAGGYMRLFYQYDTKDSLRAAKNEDEMATRTGNRLTVQTKHGSRNARVGSGGRRMSWNLNNVFQAIDETIHDISFAETASEVTRTMRSHNVASAIEQSYGKEKYQSMMSAISGVIAGNIQNNHYINSFMRKFRTAQTYAFLGYSIRNLIQQPIALTNMFGKLGSRKITNGLIEFYMHPKETIKFVQDKSEFMINRTAIVNRDSYEVMSQYQGQVLSGAWNTFKQHAFTLQTMGDASAAYPGWIAAYREGIKKFGDEKKAVTYADEFVSATIGSGLIKDQSPLLQGGGKISQAVGPEMLKAVTFMGSYFNVVFNLSRDAIRQAPKINIKSRSVPFTKLNTPEINIPYGVEFTRQMAWYLFIPAIISALIVGDTPDEDDDEGWLEWGLKTNLTYGLGQVFIARDVASLINGYGSSSSYTRALDASARLAKDSVKIAEGDKDLDLETAAKLLRAAGQVTTIPGSGSAARTLEYIGSDEEFNPYKALVTGIDRD